MGKEYSSAHTEIGEYLPILVNTFKLCRGMVKGHYASIIIWRGPINRNGLPFHSSVHSIWDAKHLLVLLLSYSELLKKMASIQLCK